MDSKEESLARAHNNDTLRGLAGFFASALDKRCSALSVASLATSEGIALTCDIKSRAAD
jgi:hypothetical protein